MSVAEGSVWPKVLASFAAGIICMSLLSENKATTAKAPATALKVAEPAREPDKPVMAEAIRVPAPTPVVAAPVAAPVPAPSPPPARVPLACAPDTSPLAGGECAPSSSLSPVRPIRVITTDKVAAVAAAAPGASASRTAPARKAVQEPAAASPEAVKEAAPAVQVPAVAALAPAPVPEARPATKPEDSAALPPAEPVVDNAAAPLPAAGLEAGAKADAKAPSESDAARSAAASAADTARAVQDRRRPNGRRYARADEPRPVTRAQRRAALQREAYERDLAAGRIRAIRLANGRVVEIRLSRREMRGYEDDDPPPSYRRYRGRSDSVMTWLGSPYY